MRKINLLFLSLIGLAGIFTVKAQQTMTPERLWSIGRVSALTFDAKSGMVFYKVTTPNINTNEFNAEKFMVSINGGDPQPYAERVSTDNLYLSPDGQYKIILKSAKVKKVTGTDFYPDLKKSDVKIYETLQYRHWDTWEDGEFNHLVIAKNDGKDEGLDIMDGQPFSCPTEPFGGAEDFTWSPDSKKIIYVTKEQYGTAYTVSTNSDILSYDIEKSQTMNLSKELKGYDTNPMFSASGKLAWLSMSRDGYESDKNDIILYQQDKTVNITKNWKGTVNSFAWSNDEKKIYFIAPVQGTIQLFSIDAKAGSEPMQITKGMFNITSIVGEKDDLLVVTRTDMNHAQEVFTVHKQSGACTQVTHVNDAVYSKITLPNVEKRMVTTSDNQQMLTWVIYPPNFDPTKKYPTLLYCQGGPQSALSQFYSYRWNFQLMASQGYIVVAPNRRGMPGYGVKWNEDISKDWGGQCIQDYLSAIDDVANESYVDKDRIGCVGASFGGYSTFYLAGNHDDRFRTFIAHDGIFNMKSMYGTTEELWFVNWDFGGAYWSKDTVTRKAYTQFDPSHHVHKWDTPILIIQGGKDYRVPIGQGLEAFQAAQLKGIKSKLLYFPEENHWILTPQNGIVWQREFFKWLKDTM